MASMEVIGTIVLSLLASGILAFVFHKFRILKVTSYSGTDDKHKFLAAQKLEKLSSSYGKILTLNFPLGLAWTIFGLLLTIVLTNAKLFGLVQVNSLATILVYWLLLTLVLLLFVPLVLSLRRIGLPNSLRLLFSSHELETLGILLFLGLSGAIIYNQLSLLSSIFLLLLAFPATLSAWFAGEFFAIFTIRQYFTVLGWDYIEGKQVDKGIQGLIKRGIAIVILLTLLLTPLLALNSLVSIFLPQVVQESGGAVGYVTSPLIPPWLQTVLIFVLIFGPLVSLALQPAGFLALTLNSDIYNTLSQFDWEEFNRRSDKLQEVINLKPYSRRVMSGVVLLFISFSVYITILAIGGLLGNYQLPYNLRFQDLNNAIKFIEVPILLYILWRILRDLSQEREVIDIASLGLKENRDVTGWTFWILQNLYSENYEEIEENLDGLLADELTAGNHRVHFYKGLSIALKGNNAAAEPYFQRAVELNPKYADGWFELGTVQYFQERYMEALENLSQAKQLKRRNKTILFNIGRVYDRLNQPQAALDHYLQALKLDDKDPKIWANMSGPYLKLDQVEKSLEAVRKAIKLDPEDYIAKTNLATIYHKLDRMEEYQQTVNEILDAELSNVNILTTMASNLAVNSEYEVAYRFFQQLQDLNAINPNNISGLSATYTNLGKLEELLDLLNQHLTRYPDDTHAKLLLGQACQNVQNHEQAVNYLQQYVNEGGDFVEGYIKLSASLANLGRLDDALEVLTKGLERHPKNADLQFNMGLTKSLLGISDFDQHFDIALQHKFNIHFLNIWLQSRIQAKTATKDWFNQLENRFTGLISLADLKIMIGNAYSRQQEPDTALSYYQQALVMDISVNQRAEIAGNLLNLQQYEHAIIQYQKVLEEHASVQICNNLGVAYLRLNQLDSALECFIQGTELDKKDVLVRQNVTSILLNQKRYQDAIPYLEQIMTLDPTNYNNCYQYGVCLALTNQVDHARENLITALNLARENQDQSMVEKIEEMLGHLEETGTD